jgi:hypothetical protein
MRTLNNLRTIARPHKHVANIVVETEITAHNYAPLPDPSTRNKLIRNFPYNIKVRGMTSNYVSSNKEWNYIEDQQILAYPNLGYELNYALLIVEPHIFNKNDTIEVQMSGSLYSTSAVYVDGPITYTTDVSRVPIIVNSSSYNSRYQPTTFCGSLDGHDNGNAYTMTSTSYGLIINRDDSNINLLTNIYSSDDYAYANASALYNGVGWLGFTDLYSGNGLVKVDITNDGNTINFFNYFANVGIDLIEYSSSDGYYLGNTGNYLVVTSGNDIYYSTNNNTWTEITCQTTGVNWTAISVTSYGHLLAVGNQTINLIHLGCNNLHSLNYITPDNWITCSISEDDENYTTITIASANDIYKTQSYYSELYDTYWFNYSINGDIINKVINIVYDTFILTNNFIYLLLDTNDGPNPTGNLIKYGIRGDNKFEFFDWYDGIFHFYSNIIGWEEYIMFYDLIIQMIYGNDTSGSVIISDNTTTFTLRNRDYAMNISNLDSFSSNGTLYVIPEFLFGGLTKFNNKFKDNIKPKEIVARTPGTWNRPTPFIKRVIQK